MLKMEKAAQKSKRKIGIDIDNVISDSFPVYIEKYNTHFHKDLEISAVNNFYFVGDKDGVSEMEANSFIHLILHDEEIQMNMLPISYALEVIKKWSESGISIHYITARPVTTQELTLSWLHKCGFWLKGATLDLVDYSKHKTDPEYKRDIAKKIGIDIMIEDSVEIANSIGVRVLLIDKPWNQEKLEKNVIRVKDWQEIEKIIDSI
jgi:uncharacterized protein